jgi:hypothetical protein
MNENCNHSGTIKENSIPSSGGSIYLLPSVAPAGAAAVQSSPGVFGEQCRHLVFLVSNARFVLLSAVNI